jgi:hypothetical protein
MHAYLSGKCYQFWRGNLLELLTVLYWLFLLITEMADIKMLLISRLIFSFFCYETISSCNLCHRHYIHNLEYTILLCFPGFFAIFWCKYLFLHVNSCLNILIIVVSLFSLNFPSTRYFCNVIFETCLFYL